MSISQNFPEEGPTLNLNFAGSKTLDPRITFSRPSTATYMDANGLIVTAPADAPRFDHRYVNGEIESLGLLVEESKQNLWNNSNDFTVWTKQTNNSGVVGIAITNSTTSPDGTLNACRYFVQTAGGTFYSLYRGLAGISSNTSYCYSVFAKAGEISNLGLVVFDNIGTAGVGFNLSTGTVGVSYNNANTTVGAGTTITNYGNGWYRCSIVFSSTLSGNNFQFKIDLLTTTVNQGIFIYGAQLEEGAFPTSYIPTDGTIGGKTRNRDSVSMTGDNFSDWYNQTEGTLFTRYKTIGNKSNQMVAQIRSTDGNNRVEIRAQATGSSQFRVEVIDEGATQQQEFGITPSGYTVNNYHKITLGYKENDFASTINGTLYTDDSGTVGSCDYMTIGAANYGLFGDLNGYISQLTYYPTRLTNAQLQTLTK